MKLFGFEITRQKAAVPAMDVDNSRGWVRILEPWGGAWQAGIRPQDSSQLLTFSAIYACVSGIAQDVAKLAVRVVEDRQNGTCTPVDPTSPLAAFFRRPNHYQNRIQYVEAWVVQRLTRGNTIGLKERDARNMVRAVHVLDFSRVTPLVAENGDVFYRIAKDTLSGLPEGATVPAYEVIHDRHCALGHPLIGVTPLTACAMAGTLGNKITTQSATFFENMARPSGMLTSEQPIDQALAERLKAEWQERYSGASLGKVAVGGNGLKYLPLSINADDAQLVEQWKMTVAEVATAFHYPLYKLGGTVPAGAKVEDLNQVYYSECLQPIIEAFELLHTEGLELPAGRSVEFDLGGLFRMDQSAMAEADEKRVKGGIMKPNEARARINLPPVPGGNSVYLQQQNYSLEALAKRDGRADPFATGAGAAAPAPPPPPDAANDDEIDDAQARAMLAQLEKGLA